MKRNLLSSAIIVAIMSLGLTGCDDKKAETETLPPANSQPAAPAPEAKPTEAPVAKAEAKPETRHEDSVKYKIFYTLTYTPVLF